MEHNFTHAGYIVGVEEELMIPRAVYRFGPAGRLAFELVT